MHSPVVGVVLAGGVGERMGLALPKQLVPVAGRTSLEHTVACFQESKDIDRIIVMMEPAHLDVGKELVATAEFPKVTGVFPGGLTRNDSSRLALEYIPEPDAKVLFHDAVRPLLDQRIIADVVAALDKADAADVAIPSADTIVEVDSGRVSAIPDRSRLWRGQTPQGFRRQVISDAYSKAVHDPEFRATDDCAVVLKYCPQVPVALVMGSETNVKITQPTDISLADKLFQLRRATRPTDEVDARLEDAVIVVFGGSAGIGAALVTELTDCGAHVVAVSRSHGGVDVRDRAEIHETLSRTAARFGRIDHVVLCAGLLHHGPLVLMSEDELAQSVDTNLMSAYRVAQEAYPHLQSSHGSLLLFTSSSSTRGRAGYAVYSSTKVALVNLTQALADEWRPEQIRVNCINPTRTATPMRRQAFGDEDETTLLTSDQVAGGAVRVLASADTGQIFDFRLPRNDPAPSIPLVGES